MVLRSGSLAFSPFCGLNSYPMHFKPVRYQPSGGERYHVHSVVGEDPVVSLKLGFYLDLLTKCSHNAANLSRAPLIGHSLFSLEKQQFTFLDAPFRFFSC